MKKTKKSGFKKNLGEEKVNNNLSKSVALKNKITLITTLAPKDLEKQKMAVASWKEVGFHVISLNCIDEINLLESHFPDISFIEATRDAREIAGKPYVYFDDILSALWKSESKVCGIINSDIILNVTVNFHEYIFQESINSFVYGSRVDLKEIDSTTGKFYEFGFDVFFFDRNIIPLFPKSDFCLGLPWWDYWIVTLPLTRHATLKKIISPIALHLWHKTNYDNKYWVNYGQSFISFLERKHLISANQKFFLDGVEEQNSKISSELFLEIYKHTTRIECKHIRRSISLTPHLDSELEISVDEFFLNFFNNKNEAETRDVNRHLIKDLLLYLMKKGLFEEARLLVFDLYRKDPNNLEILHYQIIFAFILGNFANATYLIKLLLNKQLSDHTSLEILKYYKKFHIQEAKANNELKVSAIVSVYNSEKFIKGCLDDLINQTLFKKGQLEILIVNSGSQQNEEEIIKKYQSVNENIKYIKTEKETIYSAWNRGIKEAKGKYITNANTDDRHKSEALEILCNYLEEHPELDVLYADQYKTQVPNDYFNSNTIKYEQSWAMFDHDLLLFGCFIGPQPMWKKSLHDKFGLFHDELKVVGDYEFWLRISREAKFYHLPEKLGLYYYSSTTAEHRDKSLTDKEHFSVQFYYLAKYVKNQNEVNRIKNKLKEIVRIKGMEEYFSMASELLKKREEGLLLEESINDYLLNVNKFSDKEVLSRLRLFIKEIESQFLPTNKEIYAEILHLLSAGYYLKMNDIVNAKQSYEQALSINSNSSEACCGLGTIFFSVEQYDNAKTMLEWAVKNDQTNEVAINRLGEVNQLLGFSFKHNSLFEDAVDSELPASLLQNIVDLFVADKFSEAIGVIEANNEPLTQFIDNSENPEDIAEYYNMKGFLYLSTDKEIARTSFEKALSANSTSSQACVGLGELFFLDNLLNEAKTMYEWGVFNDPTNQLAVNGFAKLNELLGLESAHNTLVKEIVYEDVFMKTVELYKESKFREVIEFVEQNENGLSLLINNGVTNVELSTLVNLKGFCFLGLNDEENAEAAFGKSININPDSSQACAGIGAVFLSQGRTQDAKTMLEWALKNDTSNTIAKASLAKVNEMLGLPLYHNSLIEVFSFESLFVQAYNFFKISDFASVINLIEQQEDEFSKSVDNGTSREDFAALYNLKGFSYLSLGDSTKAKNSFEYALNVNPESSQACTGLGEILFIDDQLKEAKIMFERGAKNDSQNNFAIESLAKVNKLLGYSTEHSSFVEG
jgi:tetratricopeptide (TPR) repeat protein